MSALLEAVGRLDFTTFQLLRYYHSPLVDVLMASVSDIAAGAGIWIALTFLIAIVQPRRWPAAVQVLLSIALTIIVTETAAKPLFNRGRPFESYTGTRVYGLKPTTRSFPSGHVANAGAAAYALSKMAPQAGVVFWLIAALISYSRVYLGMHYPIDVIGGALIGFTVAKFVVGGTRWSFGELEDGRIGRLGDYGESARE